MLDALRAPAIDRDFARALDITLLAQDCGITPDVVQTRLLNSTSRRTILCCCRQWGKSTITALIVTYVALYQAPAMIILVSPSQTQSTELFRKVADFMARLPEAPRSTQETLTRMALSNGSRIVSLPGSEKTVRGYSGANLVVIDEASRVGDDMLAAIRPMLATTNGRFIALSTPAGKRGWYYDTWTNGDDAWERIEVPARDCPRISSAYLAEEVRALGPHYFAQEYECQFLDDTTSVFHTELLEAALVDDFAAF